MVANVELATSLANVIGRGRGSFVSLLALTRALMIAGDRKHKDRDTMVLAITTAIVDSVSQSSMIHVASTGITDVVGLDHYMTAPFDELPSLAR